MIVTPYGGRIEYNIAGTPMVIHLKDSEKCQRGKRWSQVMYLYYLIGWKIDACSDMTGKALLRPHRHDRPGPTIGQIKRIANFLVKKDGC